MSQQDQSMVANALTHSGRSKVLRGRKRASYQRDDVYQLIDDLKLGHMAFVAQGSPVVIPMTFWRVAGDLYFHSLSGGRLDKLLASGVEVCISFAEASEWVLSKSAYHTSTNYRSAVLYSRGERVEEAGEFDRVFAVILNQIEEGRWDQLRPPSESERKSTALYKLPIDEGSYKSRSGGPNEEPEDMDLPVWHGVLPVNHIDSKPRGQPASGACPFHRT